MRVYILFGFSFFIYQLSVAQTLSVFYAPIFTKSKAIFSIKNAPEDFSNTSYAFGANYAHNFLDSKWSISAAIYAFEGYTFIKFAPGGYASGFGGDIGSYGYTGVDIRKLDFSIKRKMLKPYRRVFLDLSIGAGFQKSQTNGEDILQSPIAGPDYVETSPIEADPRNTLQIVPTTAVFVGWAFWHRLEFGLFVQGFIVHKAYQTQTLKYKYKGVVQPDAIYKADGTGFMYGLRLGYRIKRVESKKKRH